MEFLENRRSWENQKPPENRQKGGFFRASPFTMHLVCTLLIVPFVPSGAPGLHALSNYFSEKCLTSFTFWDTLWEQFGLSDRSALIDASLWRKPLWNLCKSLSTQPKTQPSKPLWERNGLNISRFKLFRSISNYFAINFVLITLTLTLLIVLGINFKSATGYCFFGPMPPLGLHLNSRYYTYTLKLFWINSIRLHLHLHL